VKQSALQKELLGRATHKYAESISLAQDYLASRGIPLEVARLAQLGVVAEPEVGHEVGVPGANSWKKHYTRLLADFERVFVFADGDQPGTEFARSLARELPVTIIQLPDGQDVNSIFVQEGADYFHQKMDMKNGL